MFLVLFSNNLSNWIDIMAIRNVVTRFILVIINSVGVDDDGVICSWLHSISCYDLMTWKLSNHWSSISFNFTSIVITFLALFSFNNVGSIFKHILTYFHATSTTPISNSNVIRSCSNTDSATFIRSLTWITTFDLSSFVEWTKLSRVEQIDLWTLLFACKYLYRGVTSALLIKLIIFWQTANPWLVVVLTSTLRAHLISVTSWLSSFIKVTHAERITLINHDPLHIFKFWNRCWIHNEFFRFDIFFSFLDSL